MAPVCAQTASYIFTEVADNTYGITMTLDEMDAAFESVPEASSAWNIGYTFQAGTVMFDNDYLSIVSGVDATSVLTSSGYLSQVQSEYPDYNLTGYLNLGSTLASSGWSGEEQILILSEVGAAASNCNGIPVVIPKVDGTLGIEIYCGDNSNIVGIYRLDEENYEDYGWEVYTSIHNNGEDGTVSRAPEHIECSVKADRSYAIIAGGTRNVNLPLISFVPSGSTSITSAETSSAEKTVEAYYTLGGMRVNSPVKGVNIVKYSDGTTVKIIK